MADFRRWLYAFALVALIAGFTIPASAQITPVTCSNNSGAPVIVRAQGITEQVGDLVFVCSGGQPTGAGVAVPPVTFTVSLNVNITSRLTNTTGFTEALLIIDEPNSPVSGNPILNCGAPNAPDNSVSGPGVCGIVSNGIPQTTYNGSAGHPNVFQAHQGTPQNSGQTNAVVWSSVPFDPPGTGASRTLRFTNIRADAEALGVSSTLTAASISATVNVQPSTSVPIAAPTVLVASVFNGITVSAPHSRFDFTQCITENGKLFGNSTAFYFGQTGFGGLTGGGANNTNPPNSTFVTSTPTVRFAEGFDTAFKAKNISYMLGNGAFTGTAWTYGNGLNAFNDDIQNVPGALYNTESGFEFNSSNTTPGAQTGSVNPPAGTGETASLVAQPGGVPFQDANGTGIAAAGIANQGTRLFMSFANVPNGVNIYVPIVSYLYRQGTFYGGSSTAPGNPTGFIAGISTGVAVLVTTDAAGAGSLSFASLPTGATFGPQGQAPLVQIATTSGAGLAVYEVLFADPGTQENLDVPVVVAYNSLLASAPPVGLPTPGITATVAGGFAPDYPNAGVTLSTAKAPSSTLSIPRFIAANAPLNLFLINKCACNLLFPFVSNQLGYDTSIAIANTSQDPGGGLGVSATSFGFGAAQPQSGNVTLWYYGQGPNATTAPTSQTTSTATQPGQLMLYVLSSGNPTIGLDNRGAGFQGYIIAQAQFQYCHAYAFISAQGALPTSVGVNTGYLGIVLDAPGLPRTAQIGENDAH